MPILKAVVLFHSVFEFWGWPSISITSDCPSPSVLTEIGWCIVVKNLTPNTGYARDTGFIPGLGKSPGIGKWQPTSVFLPGKSHGQRNWQATIYGAHKKTPLNHTHTHTHTQSYSAYSVASRCPCFVMPSSVTIEIFLLNLSYFHDFLLSDLKFYLLYQSYPHHYLKGDGVMWHKAQAVNSWWLQMQSTGMFIVHISTVFSV